MFWYLLYPFRGTTKPPLLSVEHPIRRAFYRHGATTARHWLPVMLISVSIGVILTYPVVFLSDFPTAGISGLPHHVWTGSSTFESSDSNVPDLEMRQVWIHGNYMQALNKTILKEALSMQNVILGTESSASTDSLNRAVHGASGFHSPLMYWNSSLDVLEADPKIIDTVNGFVGETNLLNFKLRNMAVFAGKVYNSTRLVAADGLVMTFVNQYNDSMGDIWQGNLVKLVEQPSERWERYDKATDISRSRVFEYRFQPLSFRQNSAFAISYGLIVLYVTLSLRRLKAFRSRFGLVVTALTQMTTSVLASFTICGLLNINLAQIPQEAYPFVILTIGLENIFRLINAVLAYPPEMAPTQRIANGLGDIGHSSLASAAQNLLILWLLSLVVSPGVAAFCAFAAVALLFDFFFLITFFVAVLNVDIRRLELQDSISRSGTQPKERVKKAPEKPSWVDALAHGRLPLSTRMAGSAVTVTFVLALNTHFSDHTMSGLRSQVWSALALHQELPTTELEGTAVLAMNHTARPANRLRTQDYDNARHFMRIVKPGAQSFTAKVYDPLVVVLSGSDRSGIPLERATWLSAIRNMAISHFYPFTLAVIFVVAFVTVLMNFLLWDTRADEGEVDISKAEEQHISHSVVDSVHKLDIIRLSAACPGRVISAGLERTLSVTTINRTTGDSSVVQLLGPKSTLNVQSSVSCWPVSYCSVSPDGTSMAILCAGGHIMMGKVADELFTLSFPLSSDEHSSSPLALEWLTKFRVGCQKPDMIAVMPEGYIFEMYMDSNTSQIVPLTELSGEELVAACVYDVTAKAPSIVALTISGRLIRRTWNVQSNVWQIYDTGESLQLSKVGIHGSHLHPTPDLDMVALCKQDKIVFYASSQLTELFGLTISNAKSKSIQILHGLKAKCRQCQSTAVEHLALVYTDRESGGCTIKTFDDGSDGKPLCLSASGTKCSNHIITAQTSQRIIRGPASWNIAQYIGVAGISRPAKGHDHERGSKEQINSTVRRRGQKQDRERPSKDDTVEDWECFAYTVSGGFHQLPIQQSESELSLYATEVGPASAMAGGAVAVALGNSIHVIRIGGDGSGDTASTRSSIDGSNAVPPRRRPTIRKTQ